MGPIRFILGRSGTGKTTCCVNAAAHALQQAASSPLILLVPEQATYQMERAVLTHHTIAGFSRLRVLSFNRLVFWLNKQVRTGLELSRLGRQMAVHRVLLERAEALTVYRNVGEHSGLAERFSGLLTELQQADCTPEQIGRFAAHLAAQDPGSPAARKWRDIAEVFAGYAAFFDAAPDGLRNPEIQLTQARRDIAEAAFIKGAYIWVDGFSGFTVQERELLVEMARHTGRMDIALCLDPNTFDLQTTDANLLDPAGLFYNTEQTYAELLNIFQTCKFNIEPPLILKTPRRYAAAPALAHIETCLADASATVLSAGGSVEIACCADVRGEAEWVCRRIVDLVRKKNYRYRQIAVAVPDMDTYAPYVESALARYGLPYFLDRPAAVRHHPLSETLQAALSAAETFATTDLLCYVKSGLAGCEPQQIDRLERYCLMYGIDGQDWTAVEPWQFARDSEPQENAAMDTMRRAIVRPLAELHEALFGNSRTLDVDAFVRAVWTLLERIDVRRTLAEWAQDDPADTQGHRQTWQQLTAVLDEMSRVFAGRAERTAVFVSTLADALSSLTIKLIPPMLDQVLVGSIERSRHPEIRAMFLVGATQKQFPTPLSTADVLGRPERTAAQAWGLELPDDLSRQLSMRQYLAYIALTRASEHLAISFPQQDEKGAAQVRSVWVDRIASLFTDVTPRLAGGIDNVWDSHTAGELAEYLAAACGKDRSPQAQTDAAAYVLHAALQSSSPSLRAAAEHVTGALRYTNTAALTGPDAIEHLRRIRTFSASRLGTFAACPYQHFARYILNLKRRPILRFEPLDTGLFYHKVIEILFGMLRERRVSWSTIDSDQLASLCDQAIDLAIQQDATIQAFVRRQMHHRFIIDTACDALRRFVPALADLERAGAFRQVASEFSFDLPLADGICLKGRIDRMDIADVEGQRTAIIFDFKRTPRTVQWAKLHYGLDVQLLIYLLAAATPLEDLRVDAIAGAFYLPFEIPGTTIQPDEGESKRSGFAYKAKGIFDGRFASALDRAARNWSSYYNFAVDKNGQPYSYYNKSGAVRPEEFKAMLAFGQQRICSLVNDIRNGAITAAPYRLGNESPCSLCDYKSVCRFDWQINDYNALTPMDKTDVLEQMKTYS